MFDIINDFWLWLAGQLSAIRDALNPITLIMSIAEYVASLLPAPDPQLAIIVSQGVAALDTVVGYISLVDYVINLPVLLAVLGIIAATEAVLLIKRGWSFIRSFVT